MWQHSRSDALFSSFAKNLQTTFLLSNSNSIPSVLSYTHTHTHLHTYVHTDPCWASAVVIRYSLSNCQTSTGTRHQTPTSLANPPDAAPHSNWLLPPPLLWLWPSKLAYEPNPHISIGCLRDTWLVLTDALWLRCSQRRIQLSSLQRKTTPFITSFSLSISPHLSPSLCLGCYAVLLCFCLCPSEGFEATPSPLDARVRLNYLLSQTIGQLKLVSDPGWRDIIPRDVIYLHWSPYKVLFFDWELFSFFLFFQLPFPPTLDSHTPVHWWPVTRIGQVMEP